MGGRILRGVAVLNLLSLFFQIAGTAVPFFNLQTSPAVQRGSNFNLQNSVVQDVVETVQEVVGWEDVNENLVFLSDLWGGETAYAQKIGPCNTMCIGAYGADSGICIEKTYPACGASPISAYCIADPALINDCSSPSNCICVPSLSGCTDTTDCSIGEICVEGSCESSCSGFTGDRCSDDATNPYTADGTCTSSSLDCDEDEVAHESTSQAYYSDCYTAGGGAYDATPMACDTAASGGFNANGVCARNASAASTSSVNCDTGEVAYDGSNMRSDCSLAYTSGTTQRECGYGSGGSYSQAGICLTTGACDGSDVAYCSGAFNTCANCYTSGTAEIPCDTTATSGYSADGICTSGGQCDNYMVCYDGSAFQAAMSSCDDNDGCDSNVSGGNYTRNGYVCGNNCYIDGNQGLGSACCRDENCDSPYVCNAGTCGTVQLAADGDSCSADGDCASDNCVAAIDDVMAKYCAPSGRQCSRDQYEDGYYTGEVYEYGTGSFICIGDDLGGARCTDLGTQNCDEYGGKYCSSGTWTTGSSNGVDAGCSVCTVCGGTSSTNEGDLSCSGYRGSGASDPGACEDSTGCEAGGTDACSCDGLGHCDIEEGFECQSDIECISGNCDSDFDNEQARYCHTTSTYCPNGPGTSQYASGYELCSGDSWYKSCGAGGTATWGSQQNCDTTIDYGYTANQCGWTSQAADTCNSGTSGGCSAPSTVSHDCGEFSTTSTTSCNQDGVLAYCSTVCGATCESGQTNDSGVDVCYNGADYDRIDACAATTGNCYWNDDGQTGNTLNEDCDEACGYYLDRSTTASCTNGVCNPCPTSCTADNECDANAHCDGGECVADLPDCSVCDENSDCTGGYCRTAYGVTTKRCTNSSTGCVTNVSSSCEYVTGYELCSGQTVYRSCSGGTWGSEQTTPDPADDYCNAGGGTNSGYDLAATCTSGTSGGFTDPTCTGICEPYIAATTSTCRTTCTLDSHCWSGYHCDGGACVADAANGAACDEDSDCASGSCDNDGVGFADDGWCYTPNGTNSMYDSEDGTGTNTCEYDTGNDVDVFSDERVLGFTYDNTASASSYYGCPAYSTCEVLSSSFCQSADGDYSATACTDSSSGNWTTVVTGDYEIDSNNCGGEISYCGNGNPADGFCCGDDANENYQGVDYYSSGDEGIYWQSNTTSTCCNSSTDCVFGGSCYTSNNQVVQIATSGNDQYAFCHSGSAGLWRDGDAGSAGCNIIDVGVDLPGCSGTGCFLAGGESAAFGEYNTGTATECCGDDANENAVTTGFGGSSNYQCYSSDKSTTTACCDNGGDVDLDTDCVYAGVCYADHNEGTNAQSSVDFGTSGNDMYAYCEGGNWIDGDGNATACGIIDGGQDLPNCSGTGCYIVGGESAAFGEYDTGTATECCGDDAGENSITSSYHSSIESPPAASTVCCNNILDCVNGSTCYTSGSDIDVDGNGDTDRCNNQGWYDCTTTAHCDPTGEYAGTEVNNACSGGSECAESCTSNDCIYTRNDGWAECDSNAACTGGRCVQDADYATTFVGTGMCDVATGAICTGGASDSNDICVTAGVCLIDYDYDDAMADCAGSNCIRTNGQTFDLDNDGDLDYCNAGTWIDCTTDAHCSGTDFCNANNCQGACGAGLWWNNSTCEAVGMGYYSAANDNTRTACPTNSQSGAGGGTDADELTDCDGNAGYYACGDGACNVAGAGYWSPTNDDNRYDCLAGYYGSSTTNFENTCNGQCTANYYCFARSTTPTANACPVNSSSPAGSDALNDCDGNCGYWDCGDDGDGVCDEAGTGYWSANNDDTRTQCAANTSTTGTTSCSSADCLLINGETCTANAQCLSNICDTDGCGECVDTATDTDGDTYNDTSTCDACPTDPTQHNSPCSPVTHGLILLPDEASERIELYAEGTEWTPDGGDFSERSTDSFEGTYSTHNSGSWVRKNVSFSATTYPQFVFAYKIDVGETACIMMNGTGSWGEVAETAGGGCSYPSSAGKIILINDGHWHVAAVDISEKGSVTSTITGGAGDIYIDNAYAIKNRVFTSGGTANTDQWMYSLCYDDDTATIERTMGLINYQGTNSAYPRGYMYWAYPSSYGQYSGFGNEYSDVIAGSSNWKLGDLSVAKIKWEATSLFTSPNDNDVSQYCDDGPNVDGWDNMDLNFDVLDCIGEDDSYCPANQHCDAGVCINDIADGGACTAGQNSDCSNSNCRKEIDSANYFCAAVGKECSNSGTAGYDTGGSLGAWLCTAQDASTECTAGNICDVYVNNHCRLDLTWGTGTGTTYSCSSTEHCVGETLYTGYTCNGSAGTAGACTVNAGAQDKDTQQSYCESTSSGCSAKEWYSDLGYTTNSTYDFCCGDDGASDDFATYSASLTSGTSVNCHRCSDGTVNAQGATLHGNGYTAGNITTSTSLLCYYGNITCTSTSQLDGASATHCGNGYFSSSNSACSSADKTAVLSGYCYEGNITCGNGTHGNGSVSSLLCGNGFFSDSNTTCNLIDKTTASVGYCFTSDIVCADGSSGNGGSPSAIYGNGYLESTGGTLRRCYYGDITCGEGTNGSGSSTYLQGWGYYTGDLTTSETISCRSGAGTCGDGTYASDDITTLHGNGYKDGTTCYYGDITCADGSEINGTTCTLTNASDACIDDLGCLNQPTGLTATPQTEKVLNSELGKILLAWTDDSTMEDGFKIERRMNGGSWTEIYSTAANATSYTDDDLDDNNVYEYQIRAYRGASYSAYSSIAQAIPADRTGSGGAEVIATEDNWNEEMDLEMSDATDGLVLYMPFEEGSGTTARDWSTAGNNGTITGATYTTGNTGNGGALDFNGTNGMVSGTFTNGYSDSVSFSGWIYPNNNSTFFGIATFTSTTGEQFQVLQWNQKIYITANGGAFYTPDIITTTGTWYHVSGTYNTGDTEPKVYINGIEKSLSSGGGASSITANSFVIGSATFAGASYYDGIIDEVRIYNRALTQEEIINDMQSGVLKFGVSQAPDASGTYANLQSEKTCSEIGDFLDLYGSADVCGETDATSLGGVCSGALNYASAVEFCEAAGARICSLGEVNNLEVKGTGCGYDDDRIWTRSACGVDSYWTQTGDIAVYADDPQCTAATTSTGIFVRCCADIGGPLDADLYSDTTATDTTAPLGATGFGGDAISTWSSDTTPTVTWTDAVDEGSDYYYYANAYDQEGNESAVIVNDFEKEITIPYLSISNGTGVIDSTESYSGNASMKHTATGADSSTAYTGANAVAMVWDGTQGNVHGEFWVKGNAAHAIQYRLVCMNSSYAYLDSATGSSTTTTNWQKLSLTKECPTGTEYIGFRLDNDGGSGAIVWWDNVRLWRVDSSTVTTGLDGYAATWTVGATDVTSTTKNVENGSEAAYPATPLADGNNWYLNLRSVDNSGNWAAETDTVHHGPFWIESSQPTMTSVTDDGVSTTSFTELHATWTAVVPPSGISEYQYCISTNATDCATGTLVNWTSTGTTASVTKTGLTLLGSTTYYFHVKVKSGTDIWSDPAHSDGITTGCITVSDCTGNENCIANECVGISADLSIGVMRDVYTSNTDVFLRAQDSILDGGEWAYKMPFIVDAAEYDRTDYLVSFPVNFTELYSQVGTTGTMCDTCFRVVEHDGAGTITGVKKARFSHPYPTYDAATNAQGRMDFVLDGTTTKNTTRDFYLVFDKTENGTKPAPIVPFDNSQVFFYPETDLDGDGKSEIVVIDYNYGVQIIKWNGSAYEVVFRQAFSAGSYASLAIADVDGNGIPNLLVSYYSNGYVWSFEYNSLAGEYENVAGGSTPTIDMDVYSYNISAADLDMDGQYEIFTPGYSSNRGSIYGWNGSSFVKEAGLDVTDPQYWNSGEDYTITDSQVYYQMMGAIGDIDGDGVLEMSGQQYASAGHRNLWQYGGNGTYEHQSYNDSGYNYWGAKMLDVDMDGYPELITDTSAGIPLIYEYNGETGAWTSTQANVDIGHGYQSAGGVADWDGDGIDEFAIGDYDGRATVLQINPTTGAYEREWYGRDEGAYGQVAAFGDTDDDGVIEVVYPDNTELDFYESTSGPTNAVPEDSFNTGDGILGYHYADSMLITGQPDPQAHGVGAPKVTWDKAETMMPESFITNTGTESFALDYDITVEKDTGSWTTINTVVDDTASLAAAAT